MRRSRTRRGGVSDMVHFRPRRKTSPRERTTMTLNLAPMIDVVFLLLIFFISTTTFKRAEGLLASQLPKQGELGSEIPLPITPIMVRLSTSPDDFMEYTIRIDHFVNAPTSFGELAGFLKEIQGNKGFDDKTPVVIQAADDVAWDHVVGAWNAAVRAGCKQISFGVQS